MVLKTITIDAFDMETVHWIEDISQFQIITSSTTKSRKLYYRQHSGAANYIENVVEASIMTDLGEIFQQWSFDHVA